MPRRPIIRRWTQEDRVLLEQMLRDGKTPEQIARHMLCSASAVRNQIGRFAEERPSGAGPKAQPER